MESRKLALMNLFPGQQWRNRHRDQTQGHGDGEVERVRCLQGVTGKLTYHIRQIATGDSLYGLGDSDRGSVTI